MDHKTDHKADEPSTMHLSILASKSQAQGIPEGELAEKERETFRDAGSREVLKTRDAQEIVRHV